MPKGVISLLVKATSNSIAYFFLILSIRNYNYKNQTFCLMQNVGLNITNQLMMLIFREQSEYLITLLIQTYFVFINDTYYFSF